MITTASPIRVTVIEDDSATRKALAAMLAGSPGFACVGDYRTADAALRSFPAAAPDVVLVDLELPGMSGIEFLRTCQDRFPKTERLVLTVHAEPDWVFPAIEAGASGYIVKGTPPAKLLEAIAEVRGGGSSMSSQVARLVLQSFRRKASSKPAPGPLSPREAEVLDLLAQGMRYSEIADRLGISPRTVNTHVYRIYDKLHVHSAAGAVGKLIERRPGTPC